MLDPSLPKPITSAVGPCTMSPRLRMSASVEKTTDWPTRKSSRTVPTTEANAFDHRSLHERIAADLRDEIMSGDLGPGAKLPSTVQLKARFDASNATCRRHCSFSRTRAWSSDGQAPP